MKKNSKLTNRQIQAIETKNKLFKSAIELFDNKGYNSVTIDDIVAKAGTSKGAFYTHFTSKGKIIEEQFKEIDKVYLDVENSFTKKMSAKEQLLYLVREQFNFIETDLDFNIIRFLYAEQLSSPNDDEITLLDQSRPLFNIIRRIVALGQLQDEFRKDLSVEELTTVITRSMRAVFLDWGLSRGKFDFTETGVNYFSSIVFNGILDNDSKQFSKK